MHYGKAPSLKEMKWILKSSGSKQEAGRMLSSRIVSSEGTTSGVFILASDNVVVGGSRHCFPLENVVDFVPREGWRYKRFNHT